MRKTKHMFTTSIPFVTNGKVKVAFGITVFLNIVGFGYAISKPPIYTQCNSDLYMDQQRIHQAELALRIRDSESSSLRVSCDFRIHAGAGEQIMFYFTDLYLGNPNMSVRLEPACIEPRDVITTNQKDYKESVLPNIRPLICAASQVEVGTRVYITTGNALTLRFFRNIGFPINAHFRIIFTAFRQGSCRTTERRCKNERCIHHDLVCNDYNPCGDFSDCPTGLEHLSSWTMSGIVILGLLSGGIVIIMAAVCLQRSGSKHYDTDDLSSVSLGQRQNENGVEMNDVTAGCSPQKLSRDVPTNRRNTSRDNSKYSLAEDNSNIPLCRASVAEPVDSTDRDKLIQFSRVSPEMSVVDGEQPESSSSAELLQNSADMITVTSEVFGAKCPTYDSGPSLDVYANTSTFHSEPNRPRSIQKMSKTQSFPDKTLMFPEIDILHDHISVKPNVQHGNGTLLKTFKMPPSSTPNGKLHVDERYSFCEPKLKQPAAYNYVLKHDTVFHASPNDKRPHKL